MMHDGHEAHSAQDLSPFQPPPAFAQSPDTRSSSASQKTISDSAIQPPLPPKPSITIEFCDRCRWSAHPLPALPPCTILTRGCRAPRATWIQTELFLTFPTPLIKAITLMPLTAPETGGRFRVWLDVGIEDELVWDRKVGAGRKRLLRVG